MIGRLCGKIIAKQPPELIIDVGGVGYEVYAPMSTFYQLPEQSDDIRLFTHLVVREDAQLLYGFYSEQERGLFRALIRVSGVGPKLALTILSGMDTDTFVQCIHQNDSASLTSIPGIGKKTAERLLIETRDSLKKWQTNVAANASNTIAPAQRIQQDAIDALTALGYKPHDAQRAIKQIYQSDYSSEQLIRLALKQMMVAAGG